MQSLKWLTLVPESPEVTEVHLILSVVLMLHKDQNLAFILQQIIISFTSHSTVIYLNWSVDIHG